MRLDIKGLCKTFDEKSVALKDINYQDDIETLALIGRSGCGKSTFLRILGGLIPATQGIVLLDGEAAAETEEHRKNMGFVFQQGGLFFHLSAIENITLPLEKVHGLSKEQARERALGLLERFGLLNESDKKPAQLSGGQKQRISIARAVAPKPKILLLDEPTSALDPEYTTEVLNMIRELKDERLSFIIATHEMGFAYHACDKLIFMSEGSILESGESKDVFTEPKTKELRDFLSNLLEWKV